MSDNINISSSTLSRYEAGKINIGARMLAKISQYLKFPMKHYTDTFKDDE